MYKLLAALAVAFVAGFGFGIIWSLPDKNASGADEAAIASSANDENSQCTSKKAALPAKVEQISVRSNRNDEKQKRISESDQKTHESRELRPEEKLDASEILAKYPPPHVADPYFFGPDPMDDEVIRLRKEALDELISSMQEAGLPEQDIQASISEYRQDIEERSSVIEFSHVGKEQRSISLEEQAYDLSQSLWETGESQENAQQMVDDLWTTSEMDERANADEEMFYPETGLNHLEPE